jgi:hypothetical protein
MIGANCSVALLLMISSQLYVPTEKLKAFVRAAVRNGLLATVVLHRCSSMLCRKFGTFVSLALWKRSVQRLQKMLKLPVHHINCA